MGRFWTAAGLFLPVAFAAGTVALIAATRSGESPRGRVELELAALVALPEGPGRLLVLREKAAEGGPGTRVLAFVVPDGTGLAPGASAPASRPPGGLLGRTLAALGARVQEVEIDRAEEESGAARVVLDQGGRRFTVTARPSESVALALDAGAPILAARALLEADGLTAQDLQRARDQAEATGKPAVPL